MKTFVKLALAAAFFASVTACNTVRGVGKDIETAADKTEDVIN